MSAISSLTNPAFGATGAAPAPAPAPAPAATAGTNPLSQISSEEFLGIILEELSNQDPFEPNDTSATLEQLNSLRSIESDLELQDQLEALVLQNSIGQAGSLIGRQVEGLSNAGQDVSGVVEAVRVIDGATQLQLQNGSVIDFSNILNVTNAPTTPPVAPLNLAASTAPAASLASPVDPEPVENATL